MASAPKPGARLFGQPVDPLLTAVYQRMGPANLGPFSLLSPDLEWDGMVAWNQKVREDDTEPFRSILLFGKKIGFAYYFGTVPALATAEGLQPIVYVSTYSGEMSAVPIASNLDRFFDVYSRFLELMVVDVGYIESGVSEVRFPWGISNLIAQDEPLMALTRAGRFSHLFQEDEGAKDWVAEVLSSSSNAP
ncbi:MAG TPA: hypothetical protein VF815_05125 [Myxococcaceae bacterium]